MARLLVSAIMPTTPNRAKFRNLAVECFNNQTYPDKELIIVDSEESIGAKLNKACELAQGDILIRWDDDDWSCANRMLQQTNRLLASGRNLTGFYQIYFWDYIRKVVTQYVGTRNYCLGTSMCFTRQYWKSSPFPDTSNGEDLEFQKKAKDEKDLISVRADQTMVATLHGGNTSSGRLAYPQVPITNLPVEFLRRINGGI